MRRKAFEDVIRRPYFHVKPLDAAQLAAWSAYLDYMDAKGDEAETRHLFERCLVACARYTGEPSFTHVTCSRFYMRAQDTARLNDCLDAMCKKRRTQHLFMGCLTALLSKAHYGWAHLFFAWVISLWPSFLLEKTSWSMILLHVLKNVAGIQVNSLERGHLRWALHADFWLRYARYLEPKDVPAARDAVRRGQMIHCTGISEMQLFAARFHERHGDISDARAAYGLVLGRLAPGLISAVQAAANFERRQVKSNVYYVTSNS